jgi:hypothetical protein
MSAGRRNSAFSVIRRRGTGSAIEHEPAQLVAQPLVVKHEIPDLNGELGTLPLALQAAGVVPLVLSRGRPGRPDGVGRSTELVGRHMAHRRGLTGGVRCLPRGIGHLSGGCVRGEGGRAGLAPCDLTPRPDASKVDRASRTVVLGPRLLEVVEHVLRAVSRPYGEEVMILVLEAAAATHGDEPRIADLGEDHQVATPSLGGDQHRVAVWIVDHGHVGVEVG